MLEGRDILFLSGIRWKFSWQRHQQLASLFARRNRVLFVEMALSPANLLKEWSATLAHWRNWRQGVRVIQPNLFRFTGPPVFPLGRTLLSINSLNQRLVMSGVKRALMKLNMKNPLVWIADPYFSIFSRDHGQPLTVFDWIHDDPGKAGTFISRVYRELLDEVLKRSQIIFTPSRVIYKKYGENDERFSLVPNGVDFKLFEAAGPGQRPPEMAQISQPIIGFSGTVGPAVNLKLLEFLAKKRPDWSFVFIGEVRRVVRALRSCPNVYFLGPKKRSELPSYLGCFSAGIIPYEVNPSTETVHPVKTYEYLAAGLPVVSTNLPELGSLGDTIELAKAPDEFLDLLEKVLTEDSPEKKRIRKEKARANSWEGRMVTIEEAIERVLREI